MRSLPAGGKKVGGGLSDTKGEKSLTIFFILLFLLIVGFVLTVYNPDFGGIGTFIRANWWWMLGTGVLILFAWRAYQKVSLFPRLERVTVGGGGGSGGGGGGSRIMTFLKIVLVGIIIIVVLWLLLQIFEMLGIFGGLVSDIGDWGGWPWNWW